MPEQSSYASGVPCWADLSSPDVKASVSFYAALFDWAAIDTQPDDDEGGYRMFLHKDKPAAGLGDLPPDGRPPVWMSYISVDDIDAVNERVLDAGGNTFMPPTEVMNFGRTAIFADPEGAVFCVWEAKAHKGAGHTNEVGAMTWTELATREPDKAIEFYGKVFGWSADAEELAGEAHYTSWMLDGKPVAGLMEIGERFEDEIPPHWMTYFGVEDVDAAAKRLVEIGGIVAVEPQKGGPTRFAVFADPHGSVFGVIEPFAA